MVLRSPSPSTNSVSAALSSTETLSLVSLFLACIGILAKTFHPSSDGEPLIASLSFSGIAFASTYAMIRWLGPTFMKAGLKGKDMSKVHKKEIPETMGAVCAVVYLLIMVVFIPFPFYKDIVMATSGGGNKDVVVEEGMVGMGLEMGKLHTGRFLHRFPHSKLASYLSGLLSLQSVVILGLGDDLFDIRWRHKFFIPGIASIPILIVYFVDFGVTQIVIPIPLRPYLGELFDLGPLYYIYMFAIAIFCPNSINILAGINGIEVAQSLVIAGLLVVNDCFYLVGKYPHPATDSHLFSLYMLLPFIGVSLALWCHNRYPSKVFVGDTYCYFAGMVFAVVGIQGHFSKTLLLLFIPQIFNFVYSAPQLFRLVPCPRHRLPRFNARTGLMEASVTEWTSAPRAIVGKVLKGLHRVGLLDVKCDEEGVVKESSNFTVLNLWLVWFGPRSEERLGWEIVAGQAVVGCLGLVVRHNCALWIFERDNV